MHVQRGGVTPPPPTRGGSCRSRAPRDAPRGNQSIRFTCSLLKRGGGRELSASAGALPLVVDRLDDAFVGDSHKAIATAVHGLDDTLRLTRIANRLACLHDARV